MDSSSVPLSCPKRSVLNNGQLEFTFIMFRAVSPKQWTAWVCLFKLFRAVSPKQWTVRVYFHFPKSVILCFVRKRDVTQSFASLSNFIPRFVGTRNIKFHSPLCRNTEYQVSSLVCRMTKCQKCHPQCVWSRDVTNQNVCFYKPSVYKYISNFPTQLSTQ